LGAYVAPGGSGAAVSSVSELVLYGYETWPLTLATVSENRGTEENYTRRLKQLAHESSVPRTPRHVSLVRYEENLKETDHFEDLGVDGMTILKT
jgi:hypothetical protein